MRINVDFVLHIAIAIESDNWQSSAGTINILALQ